MLRPGGCLLAARDRSCGRRIAGSARDSVASAGEPLPPQRVRPLGVGAVCSAVRPPPPATGRRLRRSNRSLRESSASFGGPRACSDARLLSSKSKTPTAEFVRRLQEPECRRRRQPVRSALDPLAPEPDSSSREPIRGLRNPICRLRSRIRWLRRSMRRLLEAERPPTSSHWPTRRNRSYHRSAAVPRLRHWPLIRPAASCAHAPSRRLEASFYATRETHS
jgi:hypothetical protein